MSTSNLDAALTDAASFVHATWQQCVMGAIQVPGVQSITSNIGLRQKYAESIVLGQRINSGVDLRQFIIATAQIAKDIEYGKAKWDMKPMLLGGPKARIGKNGRYNIIPFRHGTSAAHAPNNNFPVMPKDILARATKLTPTVASSRAQQISVNGKMQTAMVPSKTKWGGRLTGTETAHPPGQNLNSGYQHKNGKYEGMVKVQKTYDHATQSKYLTFRIVSDKSDPGSWWHPGYKAQHIAENVSNYCQPSVEAIIRAAAIKDLTPTATVGMYVTIQG